MVASNREYVEIIARLFKELKWYVKESSIILAPVKLSPVALTINGIRDKMEKLGITEEDVKDAVRWVRKKKR